jgi:hypothetical protein
MMYKTIVLELIQERPELHEQLRTSRTLLVAVETYAIGLKASHEAWKDRLSQACLERDPSQVSSEAMELAMQELRESLPSGLPPDDSAAEPPSLDAAMNYIRRHTPPV